MATLEAPTHRNEWPFLKPLGALFALVLGLYISLQLRGASTAAFEAAGGLTFQLLVGAVACGVWGKRARERWSVIGFAWRFLLCLVLGFIVTTFLEVIGRTAP